ncbi:hypothetical protein EKD04_009610 [Chloroflexales bacterium ZM16-3]|nr:hypothetical protein [Chloroflexales bacterium ZM16-3]
MDALSPNIVTAALAAATIAKILVDLLRMTNKLPAWTSPLLAVGFGIMAAVLLQVAAGVAITSANTAQAVLAGIVAASTAIGSTELQKREKQEPLDFLSVTGELMSTGDLLDTGDEAHGV